MGTLMAIAGGGIALVVAAVGLVADVHGARTAILEYRDSRTVSRPTPTELRNVGTVLVVDDEVFPYVRELKRDGYDVERVADLASYSKVDDFQYEVIMLDVQGIGAKLGEDDGIGLMRRIKARHATQIVIAYSQHSWDMAISDQVRQLADKAITKSDTSSFGDFRDALADQLNRLGHSETYIPSSCGLDFSERGKLDKILQQALVGRDVTAKFDRLISSKDLTQHQAESLQDGFAHATVVGKKIKQVRRER